MLNNYQAATIIPVPEPKIIATKTDILFLSSNFNKETHSSPPVSSNKAITV